MATETERTGEPNVSGDVARGPGPGAEIAPPDDADSGATEITMPLDGMAHGGEAVGRDDDGRVVFVSGGLPGETVTVRLTEQHERFARGVLSARPDAPAAARVAEPRCPHFGTWPVRGKTPGRFCGGCQWQHMTYTAQLEHKTAVLRDQLARLGRIEDPPVRPAVGMETPWGYRNRIRVRVGPDGPGFVAADGETVLPIEQCPITHPDVWALFELLTWDLPLGTEVSLRAGTRTGDRLIALHAPPETALGDVEVSAEVSVVLVDPNGVLQVAAGRPLHVEVLGGRMFAIPATSFFQVNTEMAERLVKEVRAAVPDTTRQLVDLHSGVGTYAVLLADTADEVWAVEADPRAVQAAVDNASGLDHLTLLEADATEGLDYLELTPDVVIVDPPRGGLQQSLVELLCARPPDTIVYVSCDPATLARDVRQLVAGGWSLVQSRPIDMFPQTYHIESVSVLRR